MTVRHNRCALFWAKGSTRTVAWLDRVHKTGKEKP
jgi:hypothetical protein